MIRGHWDHGVLKAPMDPLWAGIHRFLLSGDVHDVDLPKGTHPLRACGFVVYLRCQLIPQVRCR